MSLHTRHEQHMSRPSVTRRYTGAPFGQRYSPVLKFLPFLARHLSGSGTELKCQIRVPSYWGKALMPIIPEIALSMHQTPVLREISSQNCDF